MIQLMPFLCNTITLTNSDFLFDIWEQMQVKF